MKKEKHQKTLKHDYQEIVHIVMQALNEWDPYELIEAGAPANGRGHGGGASRVSYALNCH